MKNYIIVLLSLFCLSLNAMNEVEEMPLREVRMEEIAEPKIHHKAVMGMVLEDSATKLEEMPQRVILVEDLSGSLIQETSKDKGRRTCIELLDDLLSMVDIDNKTRIETARTIISEYTGGDNKLFNDFKNKLNKDAFSYKIDPETVATSAAAYKYIDNNLKGKRSPGNSRNSMRESQSGFQKGFIEKQEGFGRSSVSEEIDKQPFFSIDGTIEVKIDKKTS